MNWLTWCTADGAHGVWFWGLFGLAIKAFSFVLLWSYEHLEYTYFPFQLPFQSHKLDQGNQWYPSQSVVREQPGTFDWRSVALRDCPRRWRPHQRKKTMTKYTLDPWYWLDARQCWLKDWNVELILWQPNTRIHTCQTSRVLLIPLFPKYVRVLLLSWHVGVGTETDDSSWRYRSCPDQSREVVRWWVVCDGGGVLLATSMFLKPDMTRFLSSSQPMPPAPTSKTRLEFTLLRRELPSVRSFWMSRFMASCMVVCKSERKKSSATMLTPPRPYPSSGWLLLMMPHCAAVYGKAHYALIYILTSNDFPLFIRLCTTRYTSTCPSYQRYTSYSRWQQNDHSATTCCPNKNTSIIG